VLVRVRAASLNPHDEYVGSGAARAYLEYVFPVTIGTDFADEVVAVGRSVARFAPGQRVFGVQPGTFAELVVVPEGAGIAPAPAGLDDASVAGLGLAGVTALACLVATDVHAGDRVLVNGATGGVGSYLAQLARADGWRMIATARSPEKGEYSARLAPST